MKTKTFLTLLLLAIGSMSAFAQAYCFTQYFSKPLFSKPAYSGSLGCSRNTPNHGQYFDSYKADYGICSATYDMHIEPINGVDGLQFTTTSHSKITSNTIDRSFSLLKKKWIKTKKGNIVLYTRPYKYSDYTSPNSYIIKECLDEGLACIKEINERLGVNFDSEIKVYWYNFDEAKEQIGTNAGGGAIPSKRIVLYTYTEKQSFDKKRNRARYIGVHEYVHIVSFNELGISKTRLFTEGYATAIDGSYGGKEIEQLLVQDKMKTPSELLDSEDMFEGDFYPQSGFFMKWLFNEYSIENANKLFVMAKDEIKSEFEKITGEKFSLMEKKYSDYCDEFFESNNK